MPSDREIEAVTVVERVLGDDLFQRGMGGEGAPTVTDMARHIVAALSAATARYDCREVVAELVAALDAFCRMPDAGLTADDPRYQWWYETAEVRKRAREAAKRFERTLGEGSGEAGR